MVLGEIKVFSIAELSLGKDTIVPNSFQNEAVLYFSKEFAGTCKVTFFAISLANTYNPTSGTSSL